MEKNQKKQNIKAAAIFVVTFIAAFLATHFIFSPSVDKKLAQTASEMNKTLPMNIDRFTRLDNVVSLPGKVFQYNYTILENTKAEVNLDTAKKYIVPPLLNNVKSSPDMKPLRDEDVIFNYNYRDKNGVFVVKYSFTPDMYK
ncbi:MAG: hypothetical protein EOO48_01080 [Flavobacterium sp.]|nr:MAG: hypothetical protein EOO48_01080 [Flavobacterium sp.]